MAATTTPILETSGFAASVLDALASHICVVDRNGTIIAVNRAWTKFAIENPPLSRRTGVGSHYLEVCLGATGPGSEEAAPFAEGLMRVLSGKTNYFELEYPCHAPGESRWFVASVTPLPVALGGAVIAHTTITERKILELELIHMASTDSLTGLNNRRRFLASAGLEVERALRFALPTTVMMIDLDHFKAINDVCGHGIGDETLRRVANLWRTSLRQIDSIGRLGGEEFAVLLPGTDEAAAGGVAEKLRAALETMPIVDGERTFQVTASFGVAEVHVGDAGLDASLKRADLALYAAKDAGRNHVTRFGELPIAA